MTLKRPRKLTPGALWYRLYHAPKGTLKRWQQRGLINAWLDQWHHQQMRHTAAQLVPQPNRSATLPVYFLSGQRFWHQTCFCFYSLQQHTDLPLQLVVYDDGTLTQQHVQRFQQLFPGAEVVSVEAIEARLERVLPAAQFPYLRAHRLAYPNLRKLTDIHVGTSGWKLVLDSDMLFFRPPTQLLRWLQQPQRPCHMVDVETAYGYSATLMQRLAAAEIPAQVNVGICGLNSAQLDWDRLEAWCRQLIEQEGTHYYQEQALIAMLMAQQPCDVMVAADYIVQPEPAEIQQPTACLHHYVASSKPGYFRQAWRQVVGVSQPELTVQKHETGDAIA